MPMSDYHMVPLSAQYANPSPFSEHGQSQMYRELDGNQKEIRKLCEHQTNDEKAHLEWIVSSSFRGCMVLVWVDHQHHHWVKSPPVHTQPLALFRCLRELIWSRRAFFKNSLIASCKYLTTLHLLNLVISEVVFDIYFRFILQESSFYIYDQCFLKLFRIVFNFRYVWSKMALGNKNRWLSRFSLNQKGKYQLWP